MPPLQRKKVNRAATKFKEDTHMTNKGKNGKGDVDPTFDYSKALDKYMAGNPDSPLVDAIGQKMSRRTLCPLCRATAGVDKEDIDALVGYVKEHREVFNGFAAKSAYDAGAEQIMGLLEEVSGANAMCSSLKDNYESILAGIDGKSVPKGMKTVQFAAGSWKPGSVVECEAGQVSAPQGEVSNDQWDDFVGGITSAEADANELFTVEVERSSEVTVVCTVESVADLHATTSEVGEPKPCGELPFCNCPGVPDVEIPQLTVSGRFPAVDTGSCRSSEPLVNPSQLNVRKTGVTVGPTRRMDGDGGGDVSVGASTGSNPPCMLKVDEEGPFDASKAKSDVQRCVDHLRESLDTLRRNTDSIGEAIESAQAVELQHSIVSFELSADSVGDQSPAAALALSRLRTVAQDEQAKVRSLMNEQGLTAVAAVQEAQGHKADGKKSANKAPSRPVTAKPGKK